MTEVLKSLAIHISHILITLLLFQFRKAHSYILLPVGVTDPFSGVYQVVYLQSIYFN